MKKFLTFLSILLALFLSGCLPKKASPEPSPAEITPIPTKPLEEAILSRPFVSLVPSSDGHWVNFEVKNVNPSAKSIDYELVYFAGDIGNKIERGVAGSVELKGETSLSRKILFGSESCTSGVCKYKFDENISEGVLNVKVRSSSGTETYESVFRLQNGPEAKEGLTTGDGNFKFVSNTLPVKTNFLTISTVGLPGEIEGKVAAVPYGIFPSANGKGEVFFKASDETLKILFWNGSKWQELETFLKDGWLTTSVTKTGVFVLVK